MFAIGITAVCNACLALINIGSTVAFNAIISVLAAGLFSSYLITIGLLIRKRLVGEPLHFGPWQLGKWGLPVNIIAWLYTLLVMVFSFFPPAIPVTAMTMNWSCVVFGGIVMFGLMYYAIIGRKQYKGPVIDRRFLEQSSTQ